MFQIVLVVLVVVIVGSLLVAILAYKDRQKYEQEVWFSEAKAEYYQAKYYEASKDE